MKIRVLIYLIICVFWLGTAVVQAQVYRGAGDCGGQYGGAGCAVSGCNTSGHAVSDYNSCGSSGCNSSGPSSSFGCNSYCGDSYGHDSYGCNSGCDSSGGCGGSDCDSGRYFSTFGGWTDWYNLGPEISVGGAATGGATLELETKDGYAFGAAIGRHLQRNCRAEMEFAYRNNSLGTANIAANLNNPNPIFGNGNVNGNFQADMDGKIETYSGMYNLIHDFGADCRTIRPYVGAGVGFAFINADIRTPALPGIALSVDNSSFAYQAMAGLSYKWSSRVELFSEYRIFGVDDFKATIGGPAASATLEFGGMTHNIFMGARIAMR